MEGEQAFWCVFVGTLRFLCRFVLRSFTWARMKNGTGNTVNGLDF